MKPNPLPQRTPRPTAARCPECRSRVPVVRMGGADVFAAHTTSGAPLVPSDGLSECGAGGWHVEDEEVLR